MFAVRDVPLAEITRFRADEYHIVSGDATNLFF
jgi:hypothetical protein